MDTLKKEYFENISYEERQKKEADFDRKIKQKIALNSLPPSWE